MPERPDIQEALREAVDRTVRTTVRAQGAAGGVADVVDELVKGAERNLSRSGRSVRDRLPASQDDIKALRVELRQVDRRLATIEQRLGDAAADVGD